MIFSLVICTYNRPNSVEALLQSISTQSLVPNEILVIDGSEDVLTEEVVKSDGLNIRYHHVSGENRGLTKQRNIGISLVQHNSEVICFLDDDVVLEKDYFRQIIELFNSDTQVIGVGGYITNEVFWHLSGNNQKKKKGFGYFEIDGWFRKMPMRHRLRSFLGLSPNVNPGTMPAFGHGYSISFLPPSGKVYETEMIMGGVSAFRKSLFSQINFSEYFKGYGLYEDADFSLRAAKLGKLVVNTAARLSHNHAPQGRPNHFKYGLMVVRNGYYVWQVKNPHPVMRDRLKWHVITILLWTIRSTNIITGPNRSGALMETLGRKIGWLSLWLNPPKEKLQST
jgi:GT2 family glycosyltransferase